MRAAARLQRLRELMAAQGIDAFVCRSTTDLQWLTGFEGVFDSEQAHTALVTASGAVIHTDSRYSTAMEGAAAREGLWRVDAVPASAAAFLARELEGAGLGGGTVAIDDTTPLKLYRAYCERLPRAVLAERSGDVLALRQVKEPAELQAMRAAQELAEAAFLETLEGMAPGQTEEQVSLKLEFAMRSRGAQELAFANIVASGPNSANPHAIPGSRALQEGDMVVIDFGARVGGYRSDTTRTVCVGRPSPRQQAAYRAVRLANEEVQRRLQPGVSGVEMHKLAERVLEDEGFGGLMGHGLGHGVGLDIHEEPCLNLRNEQPLPAGAVVTVEPGVYIAGEFGIRTEDCGLVGEAGFESFCTLTHDLVCI
ncbi:MAG: M24 family metallopeptidase [Coriobacteriales bacterium]